MMAEVTLTLDEYEALRSMAHDNSCIGCSGAVRPSQSDQVTSTKPKRKASSSNRAYSKAFKKVKGKYMTKSGSWKKNGFKNASKAAWKLVKR